MSEAKFTSGEWAAVIDDESCFIGSDGFGLLADLEVTDRPIWENDANAHLIKTAPKMYKMLEYLHQQLSGVEESLCWDEIKELLAEARGEHE